MNYHAELLNTLKKLLHAKQRQPGTLVRITQQTLVMVCQLSKDCFVKEESLIQLAPPLIVVGNISGQFYNLLQIFEQNGHPPDKQYLFLGNYVDVGNQCIESMALLLVYKCLYPEHVFLLRGNHESPEINATEEFKAECVSRYSARLWNVFNDAFSYMPAAALIGTKIFAVNSGISPKIDSLSFFQTVQRPMPKISESGPVEDLFWSEPDPDIEEFESNPNGHSFLFGPKQVHEFIDKNNLEVIVRGHEEVPKGFEFPFEPDRCMVTIFSAPGYEDQGKTLGSVMTIDTDFSCNFQTLKPLLRRSPLPPTMNNYSTSYGGSLSLAMKLNLRHFGAKTSRKNTTSTLTAKNNDGIDPEVEQILKMDIALPLSDKSTFSNTLPPMKKHPPKTKATPTTRKSYRK